MEWASCMFGDMTSANPKETFERLGSVLLRIAGKLAEQRNSGADDATIGKDGPTVGGNDGRTWGAADAGVGESACSGERNTKARGSAREAATIDGRAPHAPEIVAAVHVVTAWATPA